MQGYGTLNDGNYKYTGNFENEAFHGKGTYIEAYGKTLKNELIQIPI